jgi:hypothetical protein
VLTLFITSKTELRYTNYFAAELLPMRHTDGPVLPIYVKPMDTMEVFFVKVAHLTVTGGLWTSMAMLLCVIPWTGSATTSSVETGTIARRRSFQRRHVQCFILFSHSRFI